MMIQIGHRESHDIDVILDDPQMLGFIEPSKSHLQFETMSSELRSLRECSRSIGISASFSIDRQSCSL
ncbi:MAG: hypothetical protein EOR30_32625 [Mesorhizobium sp.]|nr:MAG: hypothetical protein EOR14_33945 [Mesorhizobium sp.]RWI62498.1 MAG: hypothetical protein EOR17_32800 [Mesorhizobium sp.]RWI81281.1 MAG: hypothetical protein EOR20_33615 [Mesorhizobium sp.]RWJ41875.1 MAG: hypothetical protein EOR30_32625 [Mesorhizobium sp.]RWJ56923.1 MAG: hypothetical protein EOR32_32790 [Mesorhizobium sp.]